MSEVVSVSGSPHDRCSASRIRSNICIDLALIYLIFVNSSSNLTTELKFSWWSSSNMSWFPRYDWMFSLRQTGSHVLSSWLCFTKMKVGPPRPPSLMNDCLLASGKFWYLKRWVETVLTAKTHYDSTCGFSNLIKAKSMMSWMFLSEFEARLHQPPGALGYDRSQWYKTGRCHITIYWIIMSMSRENLHSRLYDIVVIIYVKDENRHERD